MFLFSSSSGLVSKNFTPFFLKVFQISLKIIAVTPLPLVEPMFKLLDETYKNLSTYTPITDEQILHYKEGYMQVQALAENESLRRRDLPEYKALLESYGIK